MEEDDEVILKDSALYFHLHDVGLTEFEVSTSQNSKNALETKIKKTKFMGKNEKNSSVVRICLWFMSLFKLAELRKGMLLRFAIKLLKNKVLAENDVLTLEYFSNAVNSLVANQELLNYEEHETNSFLHERELYFFFPSLVFGLFTFLVSDFDIIIFIVIMSVSFGVILCSYLLKVSYQNSSKLLSETVHSIVNADKIISKTCKIINEMKVIGKGLVNNDSSLEASYETCLCDGTFNLLETFSSIFIAGHSGMESKRSLPEWESIKELFAQRFSTIIAQSEGREIMLTQMKLKFCLFLDQSSAFLTELLLHLEKDYDHCYMMNINDIISAEDIDIMNKQLYLLTNLHNMSNHYWFDEKENKSFLSFYSPKKSYESVKTDVSGAINSLYVHSRLSVNNILILRNFVEETLVKNEDSDEVEILDNVKKKCDSIKSEFLSCMGCLDEVWDRAQRLYFPKLHQLDGIPPIYTCNKNFENSSCDHFPILGLTDNVPFDEVFEATVGENSNVTTLKEENDVWLTNIELDKVTRRKQMERCKRVLQEIQPILQQRREMWDEREQLAIHFKNIRNYEEKQKCLEKSQKLVPNQIEEESEFIDEIPLLVPVSSIDFMKNKKNVAEIEKPSLNCVDEYDSDEERLNIYRRVKQELYEDELRRLTKDNEEKEDDGYQPFRYILNKEKELEFSIKRSKSDYEISSERNVDNDSACDNTWNDICYMNSANSIAKGCQINHKGNENAKQGNNDDNGKSSKLYSTSKEEKLSDDENNIKNISLKPISQNMLFITTKSGPNGNFDITKTSSPKFECYTIEKDIRNNKSGGDCSLSSPSSSSTGYGTSRSSSADLISSLTYPFLPPSFPVSPRMESSIFVKDNQSSQINDISIPKSVSIIAQSSSNNSLSEKSELTLQPKILKSKQLNKHILGESLENLNYEPLSSSMESETFVCGNNIDHDNHSIDWSTCGFPSTKNVCLEDRFLPTNDGWLSCGSFNPFLLNSEPLQKNPALQKFNLNEEVFGGFGEGEDHLEESKDLHCK